MKLGVALLGAAHAAMDVSDGWSRMRGTLPEASRCGVVIHADRVPLSVAAQEALAGDLDLLPLILTGGDDYELLFTAAALPPEWSSEAPGHRDRRDRGRRRRPCPRPRWGRDCAGAARVSAFLGLNRNPNLRSSSVATPVVLEQHGVDAVRLRRGDVHRGIVDEGGRLWPACR